MFFNIYCTRYAIVLTLLYLCYRDYQVDAMAKAKLASENFPAQKIFASMEKLKIKSTTAESILAKADLAFKSWEVQSTVFLSPLEAKSVRDSFFGVVGLKFRGFGGYAQAERIKLFFMRDDSPIDEIPSSSIEDASTTDGYRATPAGVISPYPVAILTPDDLAGDEWALISSGANLETGGMNLLQIDGNFLFEKVASSDFIGLVQEKSGCCEEQIGDVIMLGSKGCQIIVDGAVTERIISGIKSCQLGSVPIQCKRISFSELAVRSPICKEVKSVEASLRLDAIASAGFGVSRSKMSTMIVDGEVSIDWIPCLNPAITLKSGDIITVRGSGKLVVEEAAITSKGRFKVQLKKYI